MARKGWTKGRLCTFPDCGRKHEGRGYCGSHLGQLRRTGRVWPIREVWKYPDDATCSFGGCDRRPIANYLCQGHAKQRWAGEDLRPIRAIRPVGATIVRNDRGEKQCLVCEDWQPESEFYASPQTKDGLGVQCKTCMKWANTLRNFKLAPEQYQEILAAQGGVCAICSKPPSPKRRLAIDHDHRCCPERGRSCGQCIRGLLHSNCNTGIGLLGDSVETIAGAMVYLLSFEGVLV